MLAEIAGSFLLGLATPLTALCVIPLYPGFISYLSRQLEGDESRKTYILFGLLVVSGVISFMMGVGILFSALLQTSLTGVIEIVSPVAFALLAAVGFLMVLGVDFQRVAPSGKILEFENPLLNAYGFGFFFGAVIVPCNPAFIASFFARAFLFETPVSSILNFTVFGLGIGFPLMAFSILSSTRNEKVIGFLRGHESIIDKGSGAILLAVSLYYLIKVFQVIPS